MRTVQWQPFYYFGCRTLSYKIPYLKGNDIRLLQNLLNLLPDNIIKTRLKPDGIFSSATRNAVRELQNYFKLAPTGKVDESTYFILGHCVGKYAYNKPVFSSRIIKPNLEGADVLILHNRLAAFKKSCLNRPAHKKYDKHLHNAIQKFQDNFPDLKADGIVGPETFDYLLMWAPMGGRTLRVGRHGLDTYFFQLALKKIGYFHKEPDGFFDSYTDRITRKFQKDAEIKEDGIVGPHTYLAIGTCQACPDINYFYLVQNSDTIDKIAYLFNKEVEDLIKANDLTAPNYIIKPGQLLVIPPPLTFHLVQKGETLAMISKKYAVLPHDLIKANPFIPLTSCLPDDVIVLPRIQLPVTGKLVYMNKDNENSNLNIYNLDTMKKENLLRMQNDTTKLLDYSSDKQTVSFLSNQGKILNKFNVKTNILKKVPLPFEIINFKDSLITDKKNHVFIENSESITTLPIKSQVVKWLETGHKIMYANNSYLKVYDINTRVDKEIFATKSGSICEILVSPDKSKALLIMNNKPGTSNITGLLDLFTKELQEISKDNHYADWSLLAGYFLLSEKKFYGSYFPWFYLEIKRYNVDGELLNKELYGKGINVRENSISPDDKFMVFSMHTPHSYFPIQYFCQDIFIKQLNTNLISRLTYGENVYSPIWL